MDKPYANFEKYRMNHSFKKNHENRAKYTPVYISPPPLMSGMLQIMDVLEIKIKPQCK